MLRFSTSVQADPLDHWHWRNPSPPLNPLAAVSYADGKFVAVGAWQGLVITSGDGTNWVHQTSASDQTLYGIAFGNGLWVAVGEAGAIVTSPDAACWTAQTSGTSNRLNAVGYGAGMFAAVGANGTIVTSMDAVNWQPQDSGTNVMLRTVAYGNSIWVANGGDFNELGWPSRQILLTSSNGVIWIDRATQVRTPMQSLESICFGENLFVLVGWTILYGPTIYTSPDGITWNSQNYDGLCPPNQYQDLTSLRVDDGVFVAMGATGVIRSSDGTNWSQLSCDEYHVGRGGLAYGKHLWVIADNPANVGGDIKTSFDLINWTSQRTGPRQRFFHIDSSAELSVAVGDGAILTSSNGLFWTQQNAGTTQPIYAITHLSNLWVAVGEKGVTLTSTNAVSWSGRDSGTTNALYDLAYGDGKFMAIGGLDTIVYSADGVNWTTNNSGTTTNWLRTVGYGNGLWVIANDTSIISSPDGVHWTQRFSNGGPYALFALKYVHDRWLGGGHDTTSFIVSSVDGINWTKQILPTWTVWTDVIYAAGYYVLVGLDQPGSLVGRIVSSPDGTNWTFRFPDSFAVLGGITYLHETFIVVGDGGSILQSDPLTSAGVPFFLERARMVGGIFEFTVRGQTGQVSRIEASVDLSQWLPVGMVTNASGCVVFRDQSPGSPPRQFYRAVTLPP